MRWNIPRVQFLKRQKFERCSITYWQKQGVTETEYENISTPKITENDLLNNGNNNGDNHFDNRAVNDSLNDNNVVVDNPVLWEEQLRIINLVEPIFKSNYETIKVKNLDNRVHTTDVNKAMSSDVLLAINTVANRHLQNIDDVTFWEINVTLYTAAVTVKQYINDLKQIEREPIRKNSAPSDILNQKQKSTCLQ